MPTKKKKIVEEAVQETVVHSVPMIDTADIAKLTSDIFESYAPAEATNVTEKKDRPVVSLDEETQKKFVDFAMVKVMFDVLENEKKQCTSEIYSSIFDQYKKVLWNTKVQPKNPSIIVENAKGDLEAEGLFIVMVGSKIKINMPKIEGMSPRDALVKGLVAYGTSEKNAKRIVEEQVFFVPEFNLNFTEMMNGKIVDGKLEPSDDSSKLAAGILFKSIFDDFSENSNRLELLSKIPKEGWSLLKKNINSRVKYEPKLKYGANFLDNVCGYANSFEELCSILKVFEPVHYVKSCQFAPKDSNRVNRLVSKVTNILSNL